VKLYETVKCHSVNVSYLVTRNISKVQIKEAYHGLRGIASPVLTATGLVNGRWRYSTPYRIDTP